MYEKSTACLVNINLDTVEDLNKLLSNQLGHACSKITIIRQREEGLSS